MVIRVRIRIPFISFICFSLKEHLVLVHYWGDHSLGKPADSTSHHVQTKLKIRTMPSVIREAKKAVINKPAHLVYKEKVIDPGEGHIAVAASKNLKQKQHILFVSFIILFTFTRRNIQHAVWIYNTAWRIMGAL